MSLRRLVVITLSGVGALLLAIVLYLGLADLGQHKGRIEALAEDSNHAAARALLSD